MDTAFKINVMKLSNDETVIYSGTNSGQIYCIDTHTLKIISSVQSNVGDIYALAIHPHEPLLATLGMDNFICLWDITDVKHPTLWSRFNVRNIFPWNDTATIAIHPSQSQAICFSPHSKRIASRAGNSGVVELDYSDPTALQVIHCTRLHHNEDVTTVRYLDDGKRLLSGALGSVVLSENGLATMNWRLGEHNVHWFEPVGDHEYLVALDDRYVMRFNPISGEIYAQGDTITRDDLEHVTYNSQSKRAYISGFDRNIYEINPQTCQLERIVFEAPFKTRWIKTLGADPNCMLIQCFDGGLYKVDLQQKTITQALRSTPPALWTACYNQQHQLIVAGEGNELIFNTFAPTPDTRTQKTHVVKTLNKGDGTSTTKRMACAADGTLWLGQTNGKLIRVDTDGTSQLAIDFGSTIRDLCIDQHSIFVCLENGTLHHYHALTRRAECLLTTTTDQPFWAIAFQPDTRIIAVAERLGNLYFINVDTQKIVQQAPLARRVKRMKWLDQDHLLYNGAADELHQYNLQTHQASTLVTYCANTIEDFIWNSTFGYLVLITYNTDLILCNLHTGEKLYITADHMDYSKGLIWLESPHSHTYPLDFITYGRAGELFIYRIHNNKIVRLEKNSQPIIRHYYNADSYPIGGLTSPETPSAKVPPVVTQHVMLTME